MSETLLSSRNLAFELYEVLDAEALTQRPRFAEHSRETFDAALGTARSLAEKLFAPHNRKGDEHEPLYENGSATLIPEVKPAVDAFLDAGFLNATRSFEQGGMQLPTLLSQACFAHFQAANVGSSAYPFLTMGAANLIESFGSEEQKQRFLQPMIEGRFFGTMALTEPHAGSSLSDIRTRAEPAADGSYRIKGNKIFISGGDHPLSENIVHMVLAKLPDAPPGVKGISLFIVPKFLVNADGSLGPRNDVILAGLFHKMGYRGTTSTALNFGDNGACVGYLVGKPHHGLAYMFQMMNEARIGVGMGAVMLGYAGYLYSLEYARERPQGRLPDGKDPSAPQVAIIRHADVRRMLLTQKAYVEGAFDLGLYAARLFDDSQTLEDDEQRRQAHELLDLLTPIVKSWPSEFCLKANELAIQILGGLPGRPAPAAGTAGGAAVRSDPGTARRPDAGPGQPGPGQLGAVPEGVRPCGDRLALAGAGDPRRGRAGSRRLRRRRLLSRQIAGRSLLPDLGSAWLPPRTGAAGGPRRRVFEHAGRMVLILPALSRPGHVRGFFISGHERRVAVAWRPRQRVRAHSPEQRESLGIPSKKTADAPLQSAKSAG